MLVGFCLLLVPFSLPPSLQPSSEAFQQDRGNSALPAGQGSACSSATEILQLAVRHQSCLQSRLHLCSLCCQTSVGASSHQEWKMVSVFTQPSCACLGRTRGGPGVMAPVGVRGCAPLPSLPGQGRSAAKRRTSGNTSDGATKPFSVSVFPAENKSCLLGGRMLESVTGWSVRTGDNGAPFQEVCTLCHGFES